MTAVRMSGDLSADPIMVEINKDENQSPRSGFPNSVVTKSQAGNTTNNPVSVRTSKDRKPIRIGNVAVTRTASNMGDG